MAMYSLPELAQAMGIARQSLWEQVQRGKVKGFKGSRIPKPDAYTQNGRPLWKGSSVAQAIAHQLEERRLRAVSAGPKEI